MPDPRRSMVGQDAIEAARDALTQPFDYGVSDGDIRRALEAALPMLWRDLMDRLYDLPVKSDYDNEAWLDRDAVLQAVRDA